MSVLSITGHGYHPPDDANRHVAKVISGKEWHDILVTPQKGGFYGHEGWHWLLNFIHKVFKLDKDGLMVFSIVFLFLAFTVPMLFFVRNQETWIIALLIFVVFNFSLIWRLFIGRPFILTMSVMLFIYFLWFRLKKVDKPYLEILLIFSALSISFWFHASLVLYIIPVCALLLSREWKICFYFTVCLILSYITVGVLMGRLTEFYYSFYFVTSSVISDTITFKRQLVTELRPFSGDSQSVIVIAIILLWLKARGDWNLKVIDNPLFYIIALSWLGGFIAIRTWLDIGFPALLYWVAMQIDDYLSKNSNWSGSFIRLCASLFVCTGLYLSLSSDFNNRWSASASSAKPIYTQENKNLFPEKGGILYSSEMVVYYRFFYDNPHAEYRFMLGHEPTIMPPEDLKIYRNIQIQGITQEAFQPWIDKMTSKDRLVIISSTKPNLEGLKWQKIVGDYWSGVKIEDE